jgi:nicotinate-nucleotide adenylyltransferase
MPVFSLPTLHDSERWKNMRVGLLGGTFNPPHEGHVHISLAALKGLKLDVIWWLVTPQNPLKQEVPPPLEERVRLSRELVTDPRILVTDLEKYLGTNITYFTVKALKKHYPETEFVWVSGMDNALNLHHWNHWQELLDEICMVYISRPPAMSVIPDCPLRRLPSQKHIMIDKPRAYPLDSNTTYWLMQKKMVDISSTELRKKARQKVQKYK